MADFLSVLPVAIIQTPTDVALFMAHEFDPKVVLVYIDVAVANYIQKQLQGDLNNDYILTHDLYLHTVKAMGLKLQRAFIDYEQDGIFRGNLVFHMQNEVSQHKIIQLECRLSDCFAIAISCQCQVLFCRDVWERQKDSSSFFNELQQKME